MALTTTACFINLCHFKKYDLIEYYVVHSGRCYEANISIFSLKK